MSTATLAADARNRAVRAFLVGLSIDVAVAIALVIVQVTASPESWPGWQILGINLARTVVQAGGAYVLRRFVDPSRVPTPLPPEDPGPPADDGAGELRLILCVTAAILLAALVWYVVTT